MYCDIFAMPCHAISCYRIYIHSAIIPLAVKTMGNKSNAFHGYIMEKMKEGRNLPTEGEKKEEKPNMKNKEK